MTRGGAATAAALDGQLGNGSTADSPVPVRVLLDEPVVSADAGDFYTCAVGQSGRVYCWGCDDFGEVTGQVRVLDGRYLRPAVLRVPRRDEVPPPPSSPESLRGFLRGQRRDPAQEPGSWDNEVLKSVAPEPRLAHPARRPAQALAGRDLDAGEHVGRVDGLRAKAVAR